MNNTKRSLAFSAGIIGIVFGAIAVIVSTIVISEDSRGDGLFTAIWILIMLAAAGMTVSGALLCPSPVQNGILKDRTKVLIGFIAVTGVMAVLMLLYVIFFETAFLIFFWILVAILCLVITSMCMKHGVAYGEIVQQPNQQNNPYQQPYQQINPYGQQQNPYGQYQQNPYGQQSNPYSQQQNPYSQQQQSQQSPFAPPKQPPQE